MQNTSGIQITFEFTSDIHCCLLHVAANVAYFRLMTETIICAPLQEDLILLHVNNKGIDLHNINK